VAVSATPLVHPHSVDNDMLSWFDVLSHWVTHGWAPQQTSLILVVQSGNNPAYICNKTRPYKLVLLSHYWWHHKSHTAACSASRLQHKQPTTDCQRRKITHIDYQQFRCWDPWSGWQARHLLHVVSVSRRKSWWHKWHIIQG
jgi:hypothetical protein